MSNTQDDTVLDAETKTIEKLDRPDLYNVVLLNDDYTPMDFVAIDILQGVFKKSGEESGRITLAVHFNGKAVVDTFTRDIAETHVELVLDKAGEAGHPLMAVIEPAPQP